MALGRRRPPARVFNPMRVSSSKNALVAAGQRLRRRTVETQNRLTGSKAWQDRAFFYYDNVGEIKYASQFYARGLAPLELYAGITVMDKETNRPQVEPTDDPVAIELLDRIQDPGGGRAGLLASYGRLMFLTGEANLFVSKNPDTEQEQWEMLSTSEVQLDPSGETYRRIKGQSIQAVTYREPRDDDYAPVGDSEAVAYRLWKRHPRFSEDPDAPMQAVLDVAEELLLLTQGVRARVKSRLAAAGILFIDDRISPKSPGTDGDEDPENDQLLVDLIEAMTTAITDEGSPSAIVPLLVRVTVPDGMSLSDLVHHLQLHDPTLYYPEVGLREEAVKRLAIGLDMPPEVLLGYADANHWSGWLISDEAWTSHLQPLADQFVDDLSAVYFRPALREANVEDWESYCIAYDATAVTSNPNKAKDAKDLHDRIAVSDAYLRESVGVDESDAPDEAEMRRRIGVLLKDAGMASGGIPTGPAGGTVDPGGAPEEVEQAPPEPVEEPLPVSASANARYAEAARMLGAADASLLAARERAGNKLRSMAKRDKEANGLLQGVRSGQVAVVLGPARVRALGGNDRELVSGCRHLLADVLHSFGVTDEDVVNRVADNIERHAAKTLYDERPARFSSPFASYLTGLTAAGH